MIKQLLNSVIAKYRDLSVSRRSIICLSLRLRQIIDPLATDKSRYFAQPRPIIASYYFLFFFLISLSVFQVFYNVSSPDLSKDVGLNTSTTLLHLKPYTRYKVKVQAFTGAGGGKKASVSVKTDETGMFLILALKGSISTYIFFRLIVIHFF